MTDDLIDAAITASEKATTPYSEYPVGAALETAEGAVYTGANFEVVNYSNTLHAEEVALTRALMDEATGFDRLAVVTRGEDPIPPCGMCRQTLVEYAPADLEVVAYAVDSEQEMAASLGALLPSGMEADELADD